MISFGEPAAMADEATRSTRARGRDLQGQGRTRAGPRRRGGRAFRDALPGADLYVDANRGWSYDDALRAGDALIELGVQVIEEPISTEDRAGRLRLAERWAVPLGGDESCISLGARRPRARGGRGPGREREDGADRLHGVAPDPRSLPRGNVPVVVGSQYEGAIGAAATIAFAAAFAATAGQPAEITNFLDLADDLVVAAPQIRDGRAAVPATPGLGVEVDEERLQRYRVDR